MALGRSIRIYLDGGDVSGIRYAELANWTGQAVLCPRSRLGELGSWSDYLKRPGIYFLIGAEKTTTREVYVGESESVSERLQQHIEKEFWHEAVVFTSKDENLTKSHIKYLESRLVTIAKEAGRYEVKNGNTPTPSGLPRPDKDAMEEFLTHLRLLLGALGHRLLDPLVETPISSEPHSAATELTYTVKDAVAHGMVTDDGFRRSEGLDGPRPDESEPRQLCSAEEQRHRREEAGTAVRRTPAVRRRHALFEPERCRSDVSGSTTNGRVAWRAPMGER